MKLVRTAGWVSVGLVLAGGAYAQEPANGGKVEAKKAPATAQQAVKPDTVAAQQAGREAVVRTKTESQAKQRAETDASKQAEIESREQILRDAEALLKAGKPAEAYTLLEPFEFERSGEVRFDYLLGIAALDSGKADKATLAFERVLAVDPNFAGARLDMARAYYQMGDMLRAKAEFERVLKQNPPEAARVTIRKYLDAIAAHEAAKLTRISGYVEGVLGHDSNIANSSTQTFTFAPGSPWSGLFPGNQLPPAAKLTGGYEGINAGAEISHSLNDRWGVFAGADLRQHGNMVHTVYDTVGVDGRAGVMYGEKENVYRLTLTGGQFYSANSMRRDSLGVSGEWQHVFSPSDQMSVFVQIGQNRSAGFPATSPTTDARIEGDTDQVVIGEGLVHIMDEGKQALFGSLYVGEEKDVAPVISAGLPNGGRTDGRKKFGGFRVGMQSSFTDYLDGVASFGWQKAAYQHVNNLIMRSRNEKLYDLTVAANWRVDEFWSIKPQIAFSQKKSNISLYSFDRMDVSLTIRRDFR